MSESKKGEWRRQNKDWFVNLGNGKTGGFKKGIQNGPPPRTPRGKRRAAANS